MAKETDSVYYLKKGNRIYQGDIFEEVEIKTISRDDEKIDELSITFPYGVVLTQDCDLSEDYINRNGLRDIKAEKDKSEEKHDKYIQSILVCPFFIADELRHGNHLKKLSLIRENWCSDQWNLIKSNRHKRFHYFRIDDENKLPDMVADFKFYYTIPRNELYELAENNYKVSIKNLFKEDLSQRFAYYLSRIGLPDIKHKI